MLPLSRWNGWNDLCSTPHFWRQVAESLQTHEVWESTFDVQIDGQRIWQNHLQIFATLVVSIRQPQTILPWSMTVSCNLDIVSWLQLQFLFSERFCQHTLDVFFHCIILILFDCCKLLHKTCQEKCYVHLSSFFYMEFSLEIWSHAGAGNWGSLAFLTSVVCTFWLLWGPQV